MAEAQERLPTIVDHIETNRTRLTITKSGRPAAVIISVEELDSLEGTLDVLSTPGVLEDIRQGEADIARGETYDEQEVRAFVARRISFSEGS